MSIQDNYKEKEDAYIPQVCRSEPSIVPRILEYYGKECFYFSDNFLRMVFLSEQPVHDTEQVTEQVTKQVENLISVMDKEHSTHEPKGAF